MHTRSRFAVAVHVLTVLAYLKREGVGSPAPSAKIARSVGTHAVVIRNLVCSLKRAGLVEVKEGKGGGVSLSREPSRITLQAVWAAVEEEERGGWRPKAKPFRACPVSCGMPRALASLTEDLDRARARALRGWTLARVLGRVQA